VRSGAAIGREGLAMTVMVETTRTDSLDWAGRSADWTGAGTRRCLATHRTVFEVHWDCSCTRDLSLSEHTVLYDSSFW
jgi:hypothetical protein